MVNRGNSLVAHGPLPLGKEEGRKGITVRIGGNSYNLHYVVQANSKVDSRPSDTWPAIAADGVYFSHVLFPVIKNKTREIDWDLGQLRWVSGDW